MMQTINPYGSARTAEIMSRYRPIAPKPENPNPNSMAESESSAVPSGIRKSQYLRNVWTHLQARPTRTRKRGRTPTLAPPSVKRARACLQGLIPPPPVYRVVNSQATKLPVRGFTHPTASFVPIECCLDSAVTTLRESVALPIICCTADSISSTAVVRKGKEKGIDLNLTAAMEEPDLLPGAQEPSTPIVISPRPVRPVGSSIFVETISDDLERRAVTAAPEEMDEIVEAEKAPVIVSDSNSRVRMCNSAYRELIGQPECGWLDCTAGKSCGGGGGGGVCRRIGGEISLHFLGSRVQPSMQGFSCRVKIGWESEGIKRCVDAYCDGVKLACKAKDYQFLWKFNAISGGLTSGSDH